jgi:hypothetical protein
MVNLERLCDGPIVSPETHPSIGDNIQGPSLIRVPDWIEKPLGRYYLYFADHKGKYIRLAFADELTGPWQVHVPGSLHLEDSLFPTEPPAIPKDGGAAAIASSRASMPGKRTHDFIVEATTTHIASPDVHVDAEKRQIVMYFHGLEAFAKQATRVALSKNGINFTAKPEILGRTYFRVFQRPDAVYAMAMPGQFYRSKDGYSSFKEGPRLFNPDMRHAALLQCGDAMHVFWTQVGHAPESILLSSIDLSDDWNNWKVSEPIVVLRPEFSWEGADAPNESSIRSTAYGHVNQLRDPAIYVEDENVYLLYAVAGESGIALAQVQLEI